MLDWLLGQLQSTGFLLMVGMFLGVGALEIWRPSHRTPGRHYAGNLGYAFVNYFGVVLAAPFLAAGTAFVTRQFTQGLIDLRNFPGGGVGATLVFILIWDFFYYWMHRSQHGSAVLWQEHLVHHSDDSVNITTSSRTHILEQPLAAVFISTPMAVLFTLPPMTIAWVAILPWAWAYMVHANIRLSFGPLWWLLASPQYHRIHHSVEPQHFDKNFAVWFPLWDILFGTAYRPKPGEYPKTGVAGVEAKTVASMYLLPFKGWYAMATRKERRA